MMMDFKQHSTIKWKKNKIYNEKCIGEILPKRLKNIYDINIWYNFNINHEILSKAQLTPLQYNVLILFF